MNDICRVRRNKGTTPEFPPEQYEEPTDAMNRVSSLADAWGETVVAEMWIRRERRWVLLDMAHPRERVS